MSGSQTILRLCRRSLNDHIIDKFRVYGISEFYLTIHHMAKIMNLDKGVVKYLEKPKRSIEVAIPVRMDNGEVKVFTGYRVQHCDARGPCKGGIRYHPDVTLDEIKAQIRLIDEEEGVS